MIYETEMNCENCVYWRRHPGKSEKGICRRYPPVALPPVGKTRWPETHSSAWCGDYMSAPVKGVGPCV